MTHLLWAVPEYITVEILDSIIKHEVKCKKGVAHRFPILAEKLSSNAPQMVTGGTCCEGCVRSPARWTFDKLLSYSMRLLPLPADLLGMSLLAELGRVNTECSDTFSRIASRS